MAAHAVITPARDLAQAIDADAARYEGIEQYSRKKVLTVWAAAALPMALLAWVAAPLLKDQFSGPKPLVQSLLVCLTAGLIWQFVLTLILLRQEIGTFAWPRVRDALWLQPPRDPKTGRVGGKVWWWALPFVLAFTVWALVPVPMPSGRDLIGFMGSDAGKDFFSGAWGWFAVESALAVFNTLLGEELLFRGLLLPRMQGVFGQRDWLANGAMFTLYHLHMPWQIPATFVDGILLMAYPSRRWQSAWIGIIVHSVQSVFVIAVVLALLLQATYYLIRIRLGSWVRPKQVLLGMRDALVMAFSTDSSTATMPVTYACLKDKVGIREENGNLGALNGSNFNNDGTALYEAMSALFVAQLIGMHLGLVQQFIVMLTAIVASVGAAGIPEAGLVTMTLVFNAVDLPTKYIALLLPVDWFLDRCRTAINVMGDINVSSLLDGRQPPAAGEGGKG